MSEVGYQSLQTDNEVKEMCLLREAIRNLREGDGWTAARKGLGNTLADTDPHMELVLAKLGMAALYSHRDWLWDEAPMESLTAFTPPEFAYIIRERKDKLEDWIPVCWYKLNNAQEKLVLDEARARLEAIKKTQIAAARSTEIQQRKKEVRRRLSLEMKKFAEEMDAQMQNPVWLAMQLQDYFGANDLDMDNLPPLADLQTRYNKAHRKDSEKVHKATLAPLPESKTYHEISMMFTMDYI